MKQKIASTFKKPYSLNAWHDLEIFMNWEELTNSCNNCTRCALSQARHNVVLGKGEICAPILFVGEGPGAKEDEAGVPFVGQAGKLLDLALESIGFDAKDYYITNVVKCRPPENRVPLFEEVIACMPYLREQFKLIRPKIVVCLGGVAAAALLGPDCKISAVRGQWTERKGTLFTATYHPAALLRDESKKIIMWQDLKAIKKKLKEMQSI